MSGQARGRGYLGFWASTSLLALLSSGPAVAQAPEAGEEVGNGEIVVTARKRAETLLDTPVAVTALRADDLEQRGLGDIAEVANSVPNVSFSGGSGDSGVGSAVIFIRGVGQTDYANSSDPGVGTYIDGVYLGRSIGGVLELADIAQVEVLRGPQGTLFGKNTIGGAINITTTRPSFTNRGSVAVTAGEDNRLNLDAEGDIRFTEDLAGRLAISTRKQDGFVKRLNGGDDTGAEESYTGRATLLYNATDRLTIQLSGDYSDIGGTTPRVVTNINPTGQLASSWNAFFSGGGQLVSNEFSTSDLRSTNATGSFDNSYEGGGASLRVEYELTPDIDIRSISAYRGFEAFSEADQDGQSIDWGFVRYTDEQEQLSQEFNLLGTSLNDRLEWIVGLYYFTENADANQFIDLAAPIIRFTSLYSTDTTSYAAFGEATLKVTEKFSFSLGGRYTRDEKEFFASTFCRPEIDIDFSGACQTPIDGIDYYLPPTRTDDSWDSVDPRLGLQFKPTEDLLLYATYSTGFKSGGFNARANASNFVLAVDPETVDSYEIGFKGSFDEGRLQISATAFRYDYEDLQVTYTGSVDLDGAGGNPAVSTGYVDNVGAAEVQGVELEAVVRPIDYLTVNFAAGYTDSEITQLDQAFIDQVFNGTGVTVSTANELPRTPELTFNIGAELRTPVFGGDVTWRADWAFVDEQFSEIQNFEATKSPAHTNLNGRIAYTPENERYVLALYGKNLTDEVYAVNGFLPDGGNGAQTLIVPNEPRELGVQVRVKFGEN